jgi:hypothetical protein
MKRWVNGLGVVLIVVCCGFVEAQTAYDKVEVGTLLKGGAGGGIGLGTFVKPLPLPDGEWLVVNKRVDGIPLTTNGMPGTPAQFMHLTLKKNTPEGLLFAMVVEFTPDSIAINWSNGPCKSTNPAVLVDTLDLAPGGTLFACAMALSRSNFKKAVATAAGGTDVWLKSNMTALAAYPDDVENNAVLVSVAGNRDRGRRIAYSFIAKREGDMAKDPAYAKHVKDWTRSMGQSLRKVLENDATVFDLPKAYVAGAVAAPELPSSAPVK